MSTDEPPSHAGRTTSQWKRFEDLIRRLLRLEEPAPPAPDTQGQVPDSEHVQNKSIGAGETKEPGAE